MANDHVELFCKWTSTADIASARQWFEQRGLTTAPMKSGVLISGTRQQVERVLSVSLEGIELPADLPVPAELRAHVASLTIPKPRQYHP